MVGVGGLDRAGARGKVAWGTPRQRHLRNSPPLFDELVRCAADTHQHPHRAYLRYRGGARLANYPDTPRPRNSLLRIVLKGVFMPSVVGGRLSRFRGGSSLHRGFGLYGRILGGVEGVEGFLKRVFQKVPHMRACEDQVCDLPVTLSPST